MLPAGTILSIAVMAAVAGLPKGVGSRPKEAGSQAEEAGLQARTELKARVELQARIEKAIAEFTPYPTASAAHPAGEAEQVAGKAEQAAGNAEQAAEKVEQAAGKRGQPAQATDALPAEAADKVRKLARMIWPEGALSLDKVDWFCRMFTRLGVTNRSLIYFDSVAGVGDGVVVLRGATNAPPVVAGLVEALRVVGVQKVRSEMRILPDRARLNGMLFGACRVPAAMTHTRPQEQSPAQTELLFGEAVFLLDRSEEFYLAHAGDGYWGWVSQEAIQPMTGEQWAEYTRHPSGVVVADYDGHGMHLQRGATVPVVKSGAGRCAILLPDGGKLDLPAAAIRLDEAVAAKAEERIAAALDLLRVPYVFGGRSPEGLDCSGLITQLWACTGDAAARDAWHQAFAGRLTATWWHREGVQPGDQVFFIDASGKIYHTGLAITPTHVLHAAPPGVQIGSFKKGDRLYDARVDRDFFMAKRP